LFFFLFKENHSGEAALAHSAKKITVTHSHLKENDKNNNNKPSHFIPLNQHHIEGESCNDENNLLEDDDDEEDFFNEKSNKLVSLEKERIK
jgi:hypothetical protein